MSETLDEWIIVGTSLLLIVGSTIIEALWLSRKGCAGFARSLGFAALSNLIGFSIGFFVFFVTSSIVLMITLDGAVNKFPIEDYGLAAILIFAALFTPALLIICKRIFLSILKIQTGKPAWFYSVASSILILVISLGIPMLIGYYLYRK